MTDAAPPEFESTQTVPPYLTNPLTGYVHRSVCPGLQNLGASDSDGISQTGALYWGDDNWDFIQEYRYEYVFFPFHNSVT